jgi:ADP-heptose:LPS heptosyltransferase
MGHALTIRNTQSPGDIVVLSAAIRDLAIAHPGKFDVTLNVSPGSEHVFWNNPHIVKAAPVLRKVAPKGQQLVAHYPLIHQSNQAKKHFIWGFIEYMNSKLHTNVKLTDFRPDMHVSMQEKMYPLIEPPYWVFLSGGKTDFRTKIWARDYWQKVIAATKNDIRWVQCGGGSKNHIMHEKIDGVFSYMVKKTGLRDFIRLIYHADGVVCAVTAAMHIAAAFNKPCVVIAGGREPWWWESYTNDNRLFNMRVGNPRWQIPADDTYVEHRFLHTQDRLPCCKGKGCWKSKLTGNAAKCKMIVEVGRQQLPKCLAMIRPEHVIDAIFSYRKEGVVARSMEVVPKVEPPASVYCLYGTSEEWMADVRSMVTSDAVKEIEPGDRVTAIKEAAKSVTGHVFWFEEGSKPASSYWLRLIDSSISPSAVCGRIYRTATGEFYPHPGFFVAPAKLINQDAKTYSELFSKIKSEQFLPVSSDIVIPMVRPCINPIR